MAKQGTTRSDNKAAASKSGSFALAKEDCVIEPYARLVTGIQTQLQNFTAGETVLIGNCPKDACEEDLNNFFQGFATIVKLQKVDCKPLTTTVYIAKFDSAESASRSKVLNTLTLKGKRILLLKSDGAYIFNKYKVVELNGLQEHPEEVIYDHMSTFGTISFILKTNTVTYIVFEESSAIEASCRCDYLDKYPVTIRSVLDVSSYGVSQPGASIETCILEQIEQNSGLLVEEEGQINNFMQLLDMENLDDYLDQDEKNKSIVVDKPLLEVGNEEIIATEDSGDGQQAGDDADVAAIEKQAFQQQQTKQILVDDQSARKLKLCGNRLLLTDLPQLQVAVRKVGKDWKTKYRHSTPNKGSKSVSVDKQHKANKSRIKSRPNSAAKEVVKHHHGEEFEKSMKSKKDKVVEHTNTEGKEVLTEPVKGSSKFESSKKSKYKQTKSSGKKEASTNSEVNTKPKNDEDETRLKSPPSADVVKVNLDENKVLAESDDKSGSKKSTKTDKDGEIKSTVKKEDTSPALEAQTPRNTISRKPGPKKHSKPEEVCKSPQSKQSDQKESSKIPAFKAETEKLEPEDNKNDESIVDQDKPRKRAKGKPYYKKPNLKRRQTKKMPVVVVVKLSSRQLDELSVVRRYEVTEQLSTHKDKEVKPTEAHSQADLSENRKRKHDDDMGKESQKSKKIKEKQEMDYKKEKTENSQENLEKPTVDETQTIANVKADTSSKLFQKGPDECNEAVEEKETPDQPLKSVESPTVDLSLNEATVDVLAEKNNSVIEIVQPEPKVQVSESVPDAYNTVEVGQIDTSANFLSDDECPLVIDLPPEPIPETIEKVVVVKSLEGTNKDRLMVALDSKSAILLAGKVHDGFHLYLDLLPRLGIKVKREDAAGYKPTKRKESPPPKPKPSLKPTTAATNQEVKKKSTGGTSHEEKRKPATDGTSAKKREENPSEKPRKTDLEKIDNRFLPAGSKLKSQAKAKSKKESSHKKHLPVPELPIELKAHLNTSFKIPKRNIKPQSIDRNASELDSLHGDQTKEEKEKQRKRFQKERKQWDGRSSGQQQGPRDKKPKMSEAPVQREPSPDYFDPSFDDPSDSPPQSEQQSAREENNPPQKHRPEHNRNVRNPPPKDFGKNRPNFNDIWNIPREKPKVWDSEPGNQKQTGNAWNSAAANTIDSGDPWASETPAQRSFESRGDKKRSNTIEAGESWSPGGNSVPAPKPANTIISSENWASGPAQQNRPNDINRAPDRRPLPSNSIGTGESWSAGPRRRHIPDPDQNASFKKDVQDNRRNSLISRRSRSPQPGKLGCATIAVGDMWDLEPVAIRQQTSPLLDGPETPVVPRRQASPQRGRPEDPISGLRQPSPQRGRRENPLSGRRQPSPRREQFGNTISSGDIWDVGIEPARPRMDDFEQAERRAADLPDGDRRLLEMGDRNVRRERHDDSPRRRQDQRRSPELRSSSHPSLNRQSPPMNRRRSRDRSPFEGRRNLVRSPLRMRSPHSGWGPDGSPNRRKRSRSRSLDRRRRSMDRDQSTDCRNRARERSVDSWGRPCSRSPMQQRRNFDRSPPLEGHRRSLDRSRTQDQPFSSDRENYPTDDCFRPRQSGSRSPRRQRSPSVDRWTSRAAGLDCRENPRVSNNSGFERLEREPINRDLHFPAGIVRRSRSHSRDRRITQECAEPGDKSWPFPGSNLGVAPSDERINKSNYDPWVNESKPLNEDTGSNAYSPSNALDRISSDEECDFTNPARRLKKAPGRSASPSPRKQFATIPLEISSRNNKALIQLDHPFPAADSPSRDSLGPGQTYEETLPEAESSDKTNALDLLKQRAERLKKLEDMKMARQKLLAQFKQKYASQNPPPLPTTMTPPIPPLPSDIPPPPPPQELQSSRYTIMNQPAPWQPAEFPPSFDVSQPPPNMPHSLFSSMPPPREKEEDTNRNSPPARFRRNFDGSDRRSFKPSQDEPPLHLFQPADVQINRRMFNPVQNEAIPQLLPPEELRLLSKLQNDQDMQMQHHDPRQNRGGSNDRGMNRGGSNDRGMNRGGSNDRGMNRGGSNDRGMIRGGSNDRGMNRGGSNDRGMNRGGSNDRGMIRSGSNDRGMIRGGSNDRGMIRDGSNDRGMNRGGSNDRGMNRGESNDRGMNRGGSYGRGNNRGGSNDRGRNWGVSGNRGQNKGGSGDRNQNRGISGDRGQNRGGSGDRRQNRGGQNFGKNNQRNNRNNNNFNNRDDQFQSFNQNEPNQMFNNAQQQNQGDRFNRNNNNFDDEQVFGRNNDEFDNRQFQQECDNDFGSNQQFQRGNNDDFGDQQFQQGDCDDFGNQQFQRGNNNDFGNQQFQRGNNNDDFDDQPFQGGNDGNFNNQQFQQQQMFQGNNNDFDDQDQFQIQQQQRFHRNNNNFNNQPFQQRFRGGNNNFGEFEEGCFDMNEMNDVGDMDGNDPEWADLME